MKLKSQDYNTRDTNLSYRSKFFKLVVNPYISQLRNLTADV